MRALVTGGTGALGSQVVTRLVAGGHQVRVMSRRADATAPEGVEVVPGNLATGDGLAAAVEDTDVVVHCATSFTKRGADAGGTAELLRAAGRLGVSNFVYPSIVGIDRKPIGDYAYYAAKLETEGVIESGGVPWTILRATQFHTLALRFMRASDRLPWQTVLKDAHFQLIDAGEVADFLVEAVGAPAAGRLPDVAGPRDESMEAVARAYLRHRASRKPVLRIPINIAFGKGFVAGQNLASTDRQVGRSTWEDFLTLTLAGGRA